MKKVAIFHGTSSNPHGNWFDWLKDLLEKNEYSNVWVPQLPGADKPDMNRYKDFIFGSDFKIDENTTLIGHSSGAVTVLSVLEALPKGKKIDTAIMVGVYRPDIMHYSSEEAIDVEKIKGKAKRMVFLHSDDDPYCPLEHAKYYANTLGAELVVMHGEDHFTLKLNPKHTKLPRLAEILKLRTTDEG